MVVFVVSRDKREVFVAGKTSGWQIARLDRTSISLKLYNYFSRPGRR